MRKYVMGAAAVAISMSLAACEPTETTSNEAVVEEPLANEPLDVNADMGMDAADMNASDANAVDANAVENATTQGSTDH